MSARAASWLAWSLAGLCVAMFVFSVALYALARSAQVPSSLVASRTLIDLVVSVPVLAFPVVGALIAYKWPKNPIGWICLAEGFLWMFLDMIDHYGVYALAKPGSVPFPVVVYALGQWLWVPTVGLLAVYLVLLFPMEGFWCGDCVGERHPGAPPRTVAEARASAQPVRLEGQPWVAVASNAILVVFLLCIPTSATSLILRYRRSRGEDRQQIKWIPFAASFMGLGFVTAMVSALIALVFAPEVWGSAGTPPFWFELLFSVVVLSFGGVPIAVGFAVLRSRLYNIDLLINRTLVYGSLTATLALIFFGGVTATQALFRAVAGQEKLPQLAVVASTLVIAALFNPLRRLIQSFIDRRYYRRKYDAAKTLEGFSMKL